MSVYWLTYRLESDSTYTQRYDNLIEAVRQSASKWWLEPSSFIVFESALKIDDLASKLKKAISPAKDLLLIGMPDYKASRLVGASTDRDIFDLMPFVKKA